MENETTNKNSPEQNMDLSGMNLEKGKETKLIMANSMPLTTYASLSIFSLTPLPLSQERLRIHADGQSNGNTSIPNHLFENVLPLKGNQHLNYYEVGMEQIDGNPSIVTRYRRSGRMGPVLGEIIYTFTREQIFRIILAYRERGISISLPLILKIKNSIRIEKNV